MSATGARLADMSSEALERELDQMYAAILDQMYAAMGRLRVQTHGGEITELSLHADRIERELGRRRSDRETIGPAS